MEETYLEDGLLIFREGILTDELDNFGELVFLLEDLLDGFFQHHELGVDLGVVLAEDSIVVGERDVPVHGREMLTLSKFLVQSPEDLHDGEGGGSDGIGEITTRGGDGTDNRDGTLTVGATKAGHTTGTLVELSELGSQVSGETSISGHLSETSRDFSEGLGPAGGGVSHHSDVETHISEVLSESNTGVNGGLTSSDRHVGGVGDEAGTLHDIVVLAIDSSLELGEVIKHFSHLVSTLTASDVDNAVGVGVLGEGLGDAGLTASESSGNSAGTTLDSGEEGIEHTLASQQGSASSELLGDGSGVTDGPEVRHADFSLLAIGVFDDADGLGDGVLTSGHDLDDATSELGGEHNSMLVEKIVFVGLSEEITTSDDGVDLEVSVGLELPELVLV